MTLTIELGQDIVVTHPHTKNRVHTSKGSVMRVLKDRQTDTQTGPILLPRPLRREVTIVPANVISVQCLTSFINFLHSSQVSITFDIDLDSSMATTQLPNAASQAGRVSPPTLHVPLGPDPDFSVKHYEPPVACCLHYI